MQILLDDGEFLDFFGTFINIRHRFNALDIFFDDFSAPEELDAQTEGTGGVFSEPVAVVDIIKKM